MVADNGRGRITYIENDHEQKELQTILNDREPISLSFSLKYMVLFNKASCLAPQVVLKMAPEAPLVVEYGIEHLGFVRFYLAPKINENEMA